MFAPSDADFNRLSNKAGKISSLHKMIVMLVAIFCRRPAVDIFAKLPGSVFSPEWPALPRLAMMLKGKMILKAKRQFSFAADEINICKV